MCQFKYLDCPELNKNTIINYCLKKQIYFACYAGQFKHLDCPELNKNTIINYCLKNLI